MKFSYCLKDILEREKLNQTEAAKKCNMEKTNFNKYVNGKIEPGVNKASDILWALGYELKIEKRRVE